ncbi:uncharacterized protein BXZ73DRAFT_90022 [Epithele typhae]|uniref:uncharacterized protein n=1 Tax=Epithele typhae TaxID=378194 RepID=UPI0020087229|nr:uncharacterized protein BXZ73DRAFT_90022 [Epithele typhae]KAH9932090.1 hypothetical protein BXZ73DRAFT_90022 [Epithele typhae]
MAGTLRTALVPLVAGLDRDDPRTATVVEAIENLFASLKAPSRAPSLAPTTVLDLQDQRIYPYGLNFKDADAEAQARARGADDSKLPSSDGSEAGFMTLSNTKALLSLVRKHMSLTSLAGSRMLIDVLFLRLASVLSAESAEDDVSIVPDWSGLAHGRRPLEGVADYLVAKRPKRYSSLILSEPVGALSRPDLEHAGTSNVFEARAFSELASGLAQAVLAVASACRENQKECARGAVTCGDHWIFFAYQAPKGNDYAKYARTEVLSVGRGGEGVELVLGVLIDWVENAEVFGPQKYFRIV